MIDSLTRIDVWSVSDLVGALEDDHPAKKRKIVIPKFQRTLVWTADKKRKLIDSVRKGLPIGSLLVYKQGEADGVDQYLLIDGLQRANTLRQYLKQPTQFFDEEAIGDGIVERTQVFLEKEIGARVPTEQIQSWIVDWARNEVHGFEEEKGYSSSRLARYVANRLKSAREVELSSEQRDRLEDVFVKHLALLKKRSDISDYKIPVIVYTGEESELPGIFERINSQGTQLNKYQIYAASWHGYGAVDIPNPKVIDKIKKKYEKLISEGYEIEGYDSQSFAEGEFSYFEYLFGFGKYLAENHPLLFGRRGQDHEADSIGFNLVAVCAEQNLRQLDDLPETLKKFDLASFERAIEDSTTIVENALRPFLEFKANARQGSKSATIAHTEFQIVSMIGKVFLTKYVRSVSGALVGEKVHYVEREGSRETINALRKNLPFHYLFDLLNEFWSGTGDSKAMERSRARHYEEPISREAWEATLTQWHERQRNTKKEKVKARLDNVSQLFLKYIYVKLLRAYDHLNIEEFEIDHVVPFARMKDVAKKLDGLPLSEVGNLALIRKSLNKTKQDKTFYELFDSKIGSSPGGESEARQWLREVEELAFVNRGMFDFLYESEDPDKVARGFLAYLDQRFELLREKFFELYKIGQQSAEDSFEKS